MGNALFNINDVAAQNPSNVAIGAIIKSVLLANDGACYEEMEKYLMPPGVSGSKFFDQSEAVNVLIKHDTDNDRSLVAVMASTPALTRLVLWNKLQNELRKIGFQIRHGRLIGVLENKSKDSSNQSEQEDGQPDID